MLVHLAAMDGPPLRFPAGADAVATLENRAKLLLEQADAHRDLSGNLSHDGAWLTRERRTILLRC